MPALSGVWNGLNLRASAYRVPRPEYTGMCCVLAHARMLLMPVWRYWACAYVGPALCVSDSGSQAALLAAEEGSPPGCWLWCGCRH